MSFGKTKKTEKGNPPVAKVRVGLQTASIWENATDKGTFYSVTFERRYRDDKGDWHGTNGYGLQDLLILSKLADLAHTKIIEATSKDDDSDTAETTEE